MNAVIHFHFSTWGGLSIVHADGLQWPDSIFAAARASRGGHMQSRQPTR
ncbi:hypothetical protein PDR5_15530 [Pseudomonas sp. DR 5-09]|nr:hypothetical protein PDR5_15530 [Pseudomonas sp. DR 5-09]